MYAQKSINAQQYWHVRSLALECAWPGGMTFTVQGFCARYGLPVNRHVRAALNDLVKEQKLSAAKSLFSDGHYRKQYFANLTRSFPFLGGK